LSLLEVVGIAIATITVLVLASRGFYIEKKTKASFLDTRFRDKLCILARWTWDIGWTLALVVWQVRLMRDHSLWSATALALVASAIILIVTYMFYTVMARWWRIDRYKIWSEV
jgi:hypothetical protein